MHCMALDSRQEVQTKERKNSLVPLRCQHDPVASSCLVIIHSIVFISLPLSPLLKVLSIPSSLARTGHRVQDLF